MSSVSVKTASKNIYLVAERNEQTVFTEAEELWLVDLLKQVATIFTRPNQVFTSRRKAN